MVNVKTVNLSLMKHIKLYINRYGLARAKLYCPIQYLMCCRISCIVPHVFFVHLQKLVVDIHKDRWQ